MAGDGVVVTLKGAYLWLDGENDGWRRFYKVEMLPKIKNHIGKCYEYPLSQNKCYLNKFLYLQNVVSFMNLKG